MARPRVLVLSVSAAFVFLIQGSAAPVPVAPPQTADASVVEILHRPFDQILDLNVRDGLVYYRALRSERGRLDRYVASLNVPSATYNGWSREQKMAFWVNAYNAFVLQTVINHYPIRGRSSEYPSNSIRQIPGAFEKQAFRAGGRSVTLDGIEKEILTPLADARAFLALGRGSIGGGRLRSEAYDPDRLDKQFEAVASEAVGRKEIVRVDGLNNQMTLSPLLSWREPAFVASFADKAHPVFKERSAIERAALGMIQPYITTSEAEFLEKNAFSVVFHKFDWRLNDLSNRPPDEDQD